MLGIGVTATDTEIGKNSSKWSLGGSYAAPRL